MLDQHVAVTMDQNTCNLSASPRDAKTIAYRPWINIWRLIWRRAWWQNKTAQRLSLWAANIWWALEDLNF
ncbi:hypothetical protein DXC67_04010 [Collinsella sp. TF07-1]|nr:hypothetical protein DXC67_04010 [Collinsella sp. TF07-1]